MHDAETYRAQLLEVTRELELARQILITDAETYRAQLLEVARERDLARLELEQSRERNKSLCDRISILELRLKALERRVKAA